MNLNNNNQFPSILIIKGDTAEKMLALTYDTGFEDSEASQILNVLKKHNVKCTFFVTGVWAKKFPVLANRIVLEGHEIANHSLDHPDMVKISYEDIIKNVIDGEKAIEEVTGIKTTLLRHPYGSWDDKVLKAVGEAGYKYSIYWSIDTLDWKLPPMQSIVNKVLGKLNKGDIVLMHIGGNNTAEATDRVIVNLKARGYKLVKVSEMLK